VLQVKSEYWLGFLFEEGPAFRFSNANDSIKKNGPGAETVDNS
jgi:hypothetical protein